MAEKKSAAVIGAGLGGLSAAIHLARAGYAVDVYEKNHSPGGKAGCLSGSGFRFDTGPSLLTLPFVLEELFQTAGEKIRDYLHIEPLEILCRYFYSDKTIIDAYRDPEKFSKEIYLKTGESSSALQAYLEYCKNIYDLTADLFLFSSFSEISNFLNRKALNTLLNISKLDPFRTMNEAVGSFFTDSRIIQLFNRYATYNGSNPFSAPATLNIIPHVEYNMGGYLVKEGMFALPEALESLAIKKGIRFFYNTNVSKIRIENSKVSGIIANRKEISYSTIISNADVSYTHNHLLNSPLKFSRKTETSSSAIIFYWGIKGIFPQLEIHNILFSKDYRAEFEELFRTGEVPSDPTIYIYISSKINPSDSPKGHENWFVMINAPAHSCQNWETVIDKTRSIIIKKIRSYTGINISGSIVTEEYATPEMMEKSTNSSGGSIYGFASNSRRSAFIRQKNRSKKFKGLYFSGGTVHPGGGIPLVLLSGKFAAEAILKDAE